MTMEAKIRPWLLWTLLGVVLIGGGFTYWYITGSKGSTTTTTSPTPTKTAVASPGTTPTATKSSSTTSGTDGQTTTPTVETKTWEGKLGIKDPNGSTDLSCIPTISFQYPTDYRVDIQAGTPSVAGWTSILVDYNLSADNPEKIVLMNGSYESGTYTTSSKCTEPTYENLTNFANRNSITDYKSLTINGLQAIQYTNNNKKTTAIQNTNKIVVTIVWASGTNSAAYDTVVNSFKFQ